MSTQLFFWNTNSYPRAIPQDAYYDMSPTSLSVAGTTINTDTFTTTERPFLKTASNKPCNFWSERVATQVTISGSVTFDMNVTAASGFTGRVRAYLSKVTAGGSNVETLIGQADATADINNLWTHFSFSFTPAVAVVVAPRERFICRVSVMPVAGSFGTAGLQASMEFGSPGFTPPRVCSVTFTETVTFQPNGYILRTRHTTNNGIGNFYDLDQAINTGSASTGVVNTVASGGEIQWTRTAGGTLLEWISARIGAPGWLVDAVNLFGTANTGNFGPERAPTLYAQESNAAANVATRLKLFRRKPDGTETLVMTWVYTLGEMSSTSAQPQVMGTTVGAARATVTLNNVTMFAEDDRIVLRAYIGPFAALTMGGPYTATLTYDGITANSTGDCFVSIFDSPEFKASGDPAAPLHESGLMLGGVGN